MTDETEPVSRRTKSIGCLLVFTYSMVCMVVGAGCALIWAWR